MTVYEAWASGRRFVVCGGVLTRISMPSAARSFVMMTRGDRRHPGARCWMAAPDTVVDEVVEPNSPRFRELRWRRDDGAAVADYEIPF